MSIRGFIFDFDGLIVDTETPHFLAWEETYAPFGVSFPTQRLVADIGTTNGKFDPLQYLQSCVSHKLDLDEIIHRKRQRTLELIEKKPVLPGVMDYIDYAKVNRLRIGLASSSPRSWIERHLGQRNLLGHFECIFTADDVSRTKPDPELFKRAMTALELKPEETLILEDSPLGAQAAKSAGAFCLVAASHYTRSLDLSKADILLNSLAELSPADAVSRFNDHH